MNMFRVGDRVRCVDGSRYFPEPRTGREYTIEYVDRVSGDVGLQGVDLRPEWHAARFELVSRAPAPIEYDPPKTRHGFIPGEFVRFGVDGCGFVKCDEPYSTGLVRLVDGRLVRAAALRLDISDDPGDPYITGMRPARGALADIGAASHLNAQAKGFYDKCPNLRDPFWLGTRCALVMTEVAEMVEAVRDGNVKGSTTNGKPEGLPSEMADVVIRLADLAHSLGIDLDRAVAEKMAYNATRVHMHGRGM